VPHFLAQWTRGPFWNIPETFLCREAKMELILGTVAWNRLHGQLLSHYQGFSSNFAVTAVTPNARKMYYLKPFKDRLIVDF
jgi:hypothetical protein